MNTYIQREGEFYDFSGKEFGSMAMYAGGLCFDEKYITKERDFPIGSRVFIENVGWTEIKEGHCADCALMDVCDDVPTICGRHNRDDKNDIFFAKINPEIPEPKAIDYRALLKKYIAHIMSEEGTDYLFGVIDGMSDSEFAELEKISKEMESK